MKEIARIEINTDGNHADMTFSVNAETRSEKIAIGSCLARALLDLCEDIDDPEIAVLTALKFVGVAQNLLRSEERVYS